MNITIVTTETAAKWTNTYTQQVTPGAEYEECFSAAERDRLDRGEVVMRESHGVVSTIVNATALALKAIEAHGDLTVAR
ncbi:hypothetical protein GRZ55_10860 [Chelativorans sp. ZYF759]|uniref:hypothetical protein n=1 Tax=Chelativorans sp. ZYF759 TaxID=2692213 RepID=UPI00145EA297|nr:hypothetical protein [Chelativorans sp. ZYF759]NMG39742.1 hypothetical protein [Chelativorans sp. ZYF759]